MKIDSPERKKEERVAKLEKVNLIINEEQDTGAVTFKDL